MGQPAYPAPNVNNYLISKGVLTIAKWGASAVGAFVAVGNCPKFEMEMTEQSVEHFSSMTGVKTQDLEIVVQTGYNVNFTLDEIAVENLRMFMKATLSGTNILYANQNVSQLYAIKFTPANTVGPKITYEFHKLKLTPNGAFSLIGDEFTSMSFSGKGLTDATGHATSPYVTATVATTTTTTTTTAA